MGSENSVLANTWKFWEDGILGEGMGALCLPHSFSYLSLPSVCSWVISFYNKMIL